MDGSTAKDAFVVLGWSLLSIKCCNEISNEEVKILASCTCGRLMGLVQD